MLLMKIMANVGRFVSFIEFKELSRVLRDNPNQNMTYSL